MNDQQLRELLARDEHERFPEYVPLRDEDWVRIESVTFEEMFEFLLVVMGRLKEPSNLRTIVNLYHRIENKPKN